MPARRAPDRAADLRWNFVAAVIDAAGWGVGMGLISATTILPLFVQRLTDSPVAIGMIQATMLFGWLIPGILVSGWVERLARVKPSVMWIAAVERVALLLMAGLCVWSPDRTVLLWGFFACWSVMNACMGANTPGYYKLIAKTIPAEMRGRLYGIGGAVSGLLGMAAALPAGWFLQNWGFPRGFAACFLAAFFVQSLTVLPLGVMREAAQPPEHAALRLGMLRSLRLVREDRRLAWLVAALALFSLNQMAGGFYTLYAIQRFHAGAEAVAVFTAVAMGGRTVAFLAVGWMGDRFGNRAAIRFATLCGVGAAALAVAAPDVRWLYYVFALNEAAVQGWGVCAMNYVLELCRPERASTYTAVFGVLSGPFRVVLPVVAGGLVGVLGFRAVFAAAVVGGVLAYALLMTRVPEPRREAGTASAEGLRPQSGEEAAGAGVPEP